MTTSLESAAAPRGAAAPDLLAWGQRTVDPALRRAVGALKPPARTIAGYHLGWWNADGNPESAPGGKAMRATFTLVAAAAAGGGTEAALPGACAVELVHNFSLLHDDVMDGDVTRRHRPTAWTVFGQAGAVLAGDALLAGALAGLSAAGGAKAITTLCVAVQDLILGQFLDLSFETADRVGIDQVEKMATLKTAALFGAACGLGAQCAGAQPEAVSALTAFGRSVGLAFQVQDDILGLWGDQGVTGKPSGSDLRSGKKSFAVLAALTAGNPAAAEFAALTSGAGRLSDAEVAQAAALAEQAGARRWCDDYLDRLLAEARQHLAGAELAPEPVTELLTLADFAGRREN